VTKYGGQFEKFTQKSQVDDCRATRLIFNIYPIVFFAFGSVKEVLMDSSDTAVSRWRRTVFIHERTAI
jgi:hypothetical protein